MHSWINVGIATPVRPAAQRRVQACLACSLCSFGMNTFLSPSTTSPSPFNHPSALCHQGLVCISRIFYQLKSMAWALFHLASLTECHDFEIHPSCCVYQLFTAFSYLSDPSANPFSTWWPFWWLPFSITNRLLYTGVFFCRHRFLFLSGKHLRVA